MARGVRDVTLAYSLLAGPDRTAAFSLGVRPFDGVIAIPLRARYMWAG